MITMKEIAMIADVSTTTVSNVIHGKINKVSPDTVDKIQRLLEENNYIPRFGLNALTNRGSKMIGIIIHTPEFFEQMPYERPFYGKVIGMLEHVFRERGYYIMLYSSKDLQDIMTMVLGWNIDGIITISMPQEYYQKIQEKTKKPVVAIDLLDEDDRLDHCYSVTSKDYDGGSQVMKYLIQQGFKEIIFIANVKEGADLYRYQGANEVYKKHFKLGTDLKYYILERTYEERVRTYESLERYAQKGENALFFSTDLNAVEAIGYFREKQIQVPEDISVVGFDDDIYARLCIPQLTSMKVDSEKKARLAAKMLMKLIEGEKVEEKHIKIDVQFMKRNSVLEKRIEK